VRGFKPYRRPIQARDGSWWVTDLYAAAFVHALGHELVRIEPTAHGRSAFVFGINNAFEADYNSFADGEAISIRRFLDSVYHLKSMLQEFSRTTNPSPQDNGSCCVQP
jgi:hypothetical protein